jgi:hypothetical protein
VQLRVLFSSMLGLNGVIMKLLIVFVLSVLLYWLSEYVISLLFTEVGPKRELYFASGLIMRALSLLGLSLSVLFIILRKQSGQNRNVLLICLLVSPLVYSFVSATKVVDSFALVKILNEGPARIFDSKDYGALVESEKIPIHELSDMTKAIAQQSYIWKEHHDVYVTVEGTVVNYLPSPEDITKMREHRRNIDVIKSRAHIKIVEVALCVILFLYSLYRLYRR